MVKITTLMHAQAIAARHFPVPENAVALVSVLTQVRQMRRAGKDIDEQFILDNWFKKK